MTSTTLLQELGDPANHTAWHGYVDRYRPLIVQYALRVGVAYDEAEDLAQAALLEFATDYRAGKYERERGRLRSWLFGIVHNQIRTWRRRRARRREVQVDERSGADELIEAIESRECMERIWDDEWQQAILQRALTQVRSEVDPRTLDAFEAFALRGQAAEQVALRCGMTTNAVFGAKRRIVQRLRELMPFMEETW